MDKWQTMYGEPDSSYGKFSDELCYKLKKGSYSYGSVCNIETRDNLDSDFHIYILEFNSTEAWRILRSIYLPFIFETKKVIIENLSRT